MTVVSLVIWMSPDLTDNKSSLVQTMAARQQNITWANCDRILCDLMAWLGHNKLTWILYVILSFFYINHVCSPDGGNKEIYIYIRKYESAFTLICKNIKVSSRFNEISINNVISILFWPSQKHHLRQKGWMKETLFIMPTWICPYLEVRFCVVYNNWLQWF